MLIERTTRDTILFRFVPRPPPRQEQYRDPRLDTVGGMVSHEAR